MTENERIASIRLQLIPGLGPVQARKLLETCGSATAIFTDKPLVRTLRLRSGVKDVLFSKQYLERAQREYAFVCEQGFGCIPFTDPEYPRLLLECADFPLVLYTEGRMNLNPPGPALAVVGTRQMTDYGQRTCQELITGLAGANPLIVSGLAYGVDICAQTAALDWGLQTVACLAHGLDRLYPPEHAAYREALVAQGGLITEFPSGTPPEPGFFLRRNRIIAGMTQATVVVESPLKGGSLVTADLAFDYNRQVFAIPGRMGDGHSAGCNRLIREQKAELLDDAGQLLDAMRWDSTPSARRMEIPFPPEHRDAKARELWNRLDQKDPVHLDDLASDCGVSVSRVAQQLFEWELGGYIQSLPGKKYILAGFGYRPPGRG